VDFVYHPDRLSTPLRRIGPKGSPDGTVANERGQCRLRAVVTDNVRPGVVVSTKGRWLARAVDGHGVNWTTSDALGDLGGQSTFHSNLVHVRPADC
jgi:anaerobic selenocysteine-containing dehydrogenase